MKCNNCNTTEHEPQAIFCHICGTRLSAPSGRNKSCFEDCGSFSEGLAMVRINGRAGLIDKTGRIVVPPRFLQIGAKNYNSPYYNYSYGFSEGLIAASVGEYPNIFYGGIDHKGEYVIQPKYDILGTFSEGLAPFLRDGKWGYIDKRGVEVIPPAYRDAGPFSAGIAIVTTNTNRAVFIDKKGRIVLEKTKNRVFCWNNDSFPLTKNEFSRANNYHDGWARVECFSSGVEGFIDRDGIFNRITYDNFGDFNEGLAWFCVNNYTKCGYIDTRFQVVIDTRFDEASDFHDGLATARLGGKWGYIDKSGQWVIPCQFDKALPFQENLAAVAIDNRYGYIDRSGNMVIRPRFSNVQPFSEGLAAVEENGMWGFIDKTGEYAF